MTLRRLGMVLSAVWLAGVASAQPTREPAAESLAVDASVDRAVLFLARRQTPPGGGPSAEVGSFSADRFPVALTALSVLAMLSAGHTEDDGRYGLVLLRAADYLVSRLPEDGFYGRLDGSRMYGQALVVLALSELSVQSFSVERRRDYRRVLERAAGMLMAAQRVEKEARYAGGWRYEPQSTDADLSVTGWCVLALSTARLAGVDVPDEVFARAAAFARGCLVREGDAVGFAYQPGGGLSTGPTAAGVMVMHLAGAVGAGGDAAEVVAAATATLGRRPVRFEDRFAYYAAHAAVLATHHADPAVRRSPGAGVARGAVWAWAVPLLLPLQQEDGGLPTSRTGEEPGRIYATAMAILTLTAPNGVLLSHQP